MTDTAPDDMEAPSLGSISAESQAPAPACPACGAPMEPAEESGMCGLPRERQVWLCPSCGAREAR
jgi:hypothetical protein